MTWLRWTWCGILLKKIGWPFPQFFVKCKARSTPCCAPITHAIRNLIFDIQCEVQWDIADKCRMNRGLLESGVCEGYWATWTKILDMGHRICLWKISSTWFSTSQAANQNGTPDCQAWAFHKASDRDFDWGKYGRSTVPSPEIDSENLSQRPKRMTIVKTSGRINTKEEFLSKDILCFFKLC